MLLVVFAIQGRTVVVFPRFLRFFLRFLSEVEGVFSHIFVETPFGTSSFVKSTGLLNISLRSSIFFRLKKNFYSKNLFFFLEGENFFFTAVNIPRNQEYCVCVFFVQLKTVSAELNFSP